MKNTVTQRLVLGLVALFLLAYVGFQIYRYVSGQYKTETVYTYTVAETARVTGIALRDEIVLDERISSGVAAYIPADGAKVSTDSPIAEVYRSADEVTNIRRLRDLENRRALLEKAQDPGTTSFAHTDVLNKQIFGELGNVIDAVNSNDFTGLQDTSDKLLVLMNTKQIATGKQENFSDAIDSILAEETYYKGKITEDPRVIYAPQPGYFARNIDGMENRVDLTKLGELTPADVLDLLLMPAPTKPSKQVGRLMVDHNWYFAVTVPADELGKYRKGGAVTLDFNISGLAPVPAVISHINTEKKEPEADAVVIFRCDYVNEELINLRVSQADVQFKSISGLRISSSAIRFIGVQKGAYIKVGEKLAFRPVEVIHEDSGFVLCREETDPARLKNSLQQFDEVIIGGGKLQGSMIEGVKSSDGKPY